jgi:hypothetical protein
MLVDGDPDYFLNLLLSDYVSLIRAHYDWSACVKASRLGRRCIQKRHG